MNRFRNFALVALLALLLMGAQSCGSATPSADAANEAAQATAYEQATATVPVPRTSNYVARENLAEYMRRMDNPSILWYVYLLADTGQVIGYHIGTYPQSVCTFMTPPVREYNVYGSGANPLGPAPALDGIFYGDGGCTTNFMFDDATGAMIFIGDMKFVAYDQPLNIQAEPLTFQSE